MKSKNSGGGCKERKDAFLGRLECDLIIFYKDRGAEIIQLFRTRKKHSLQSYLQIF